MLDQRPRNGDALRDALADQNVTFAYDLQQSLTAQPLDRAGIQLALIAFSLLTLTSLSIVLATPLSLRFLLTIGAGLGLGAVFAVALIIFMDVGGTVLFPLPALSLMALGFGVLIILRDRLAPRSSTPRYHEGTTP